MRSSLLLVMMLAATPPALARAQASDQPAPAPAGEATPQPAPKPKAAPKAKAKAKKAKKKAVKAAPAAGAAADAAAGPAATTGAAAGNAGAGAAATSAGGAAASSAALPPAAGYPPATAPLPPPPPAEVAPAAAPPPASPTATAAALRHFALQLDLGWPGGGAVEAVYRPVWWLRASAGPAFNLLGFGLRAGVGFIPAQWTVTPTFNLDYGHFFSGDLNKVVDASTPAERAVLSDAAYDWLAGTVGVEFGSQQGFAFYLRGGLTFLWANVPSADAQALAREASGNNTLTSSDVKVRGLLPSFSLGLIWYLF